MVSDITSVPPGVFVTPAVLVIVIILNRVRRLSITIALNEHP